jgi:hypothetical protein
MNGRAARAVRREIRRSVGADAINIIDAQTNAINHQILPNLNASTERIADVDQRLTALEARREDLRRLENRVAVLQGQSMIHDDLLQTLQVVQRGYVLRDLSLFQRLRWLVCGR